MPRWMAAHPHLSSRLLAWTNAYRYRRWRTFFPALLFVVGLGVVAVLPPTGPILGWLGRNWAVTFVIAASVFTLSTARRRQHASIAAATSWLASLPTGIPVRMQVVVGTAAWLAALVGFAALVWVVGAIDLSDFSRLALAATAGAAVGLLGGWRLPRTGIGAPGFHYAIVRRARAALGKRAVARRRSPTGRRRRAGSSAGRRKPLPILLLAMMAIPMGSPGQVALAVAGVCMALFSVLTLSVAAVRVAFACGALACANDGWQMAIHRCSHLAGGAHTDPDAGGVDPSGERDESVAGARSRRAARRAISLRVAGGRSPLAAYWRLPTRRSRGLRSWSLIGEHGSGSPGAKPARRL